MIVLTGGAGFIGSCFLWKLNQEGVEDIIVVDHLDDSEKWKNLIGKKFRDYIQKEDFLEAVLANKISKPKHVIHMGACSSTTLTDADYYIKNNFEYSKKLAGWAIGKKVPFLYASSAATYGDGKQGYSDDVKLTQKLKPLNMYGFSKYLFDLWVIENKLINAVTGIKFFNVFGPNEYHKGDMRSVVAKAFPRLWNDGKMSLFRSYKKEYQDGEQKRDFIYIKDAIEVMWHMFSNPSKTGIFNLGTGQARSWNDLAFAMFEALGKTPNIKYVDMPEHLKEKYQYFTQAEMGKLANTGLDFTFRSLEGSIKDYIGYLEKETYL